MRRQRVGFRLEGNNACRTGVAIFDAADYRSTIFFEFVFGDKTGSVVGALSVAENDELMLITTKGQMVRTRVKEIRAVGRNTMGVKLMDLRGAEKLQAIAPVVSQESTEVEPDSAPSPA